MVFSNNVRKVLLFLLFFQRNFFFRHISHKFLNVYVIIFVLTCFVCLYLPLFCFSLQHDILVDW
jgi:hypothetical protein